MNAGPDVWVVATEETVDRWLAPLGHLRTHPVTWGRTRPVGDGKAIHTALAADPDALVLFTSRRGPEALPASFVPEDAASRRCACVGAATAEAARARGFDVVLVGRAGGAELARRVLEGLPDVRRVVHVRGEDARPEAAEALAAGGVDVQSVVAYALEPAPGFRAAVETLPEPRAVVLGSPRAVEAMRAALRETRRVLSDMVRFIAPGETTAAAARVYWPARVHRADRPDPASLAAAVEAIIAEEG